MFKWIRFCMKSSYYLTDPDPAKSDYQKPNMHPLTFLLLSFLVSLDAARVPPRSGQRPPAPPQPVMMCHPSILDTCIIYCGCDAPQTINCQVLPSTLPSISTLSAETLLPHGEQHANSVQAVPSNTSLTDPSSRSGDRSQPPRPLHAPRPRRPHHDEHAVQLDLPLPDRLGCNRRAGPSCEIGTVRRMGRPCAAATATHGSSQTSGHLVTVQRGRLHCSWRFHGPCWCRCCSELRCRTSGMADGVWEPVLD